VDNSQLEQELLGAILVNNEAFSRVSAFLRPEHFAEAVHARIFEAAAAVIEAGMIATPITLKAYFASDMMVGPDMPIMHYLARCAANAVLPISNATGHAIRVVAHANERRGPP
jgi:replicative DNA helicase